MEMNEKEQVYQSGSSDSLNQLAENQSQHQQANYNDEMAPKNGNMEDEDDLEDDDLDDDDLDDDDLEDDEMDKEDTMGTGGEMSREDDRGRLGTMTAS